MTSKHCIDVTCHSPRSFLPLSRERHTGSPTCMRRNSNRRSRARPSMIQSLGASPAKASFGEINHACLSSGVMYLASASLSSMRSRRRLSACGDTRPASQFCTVLSDTPIATASCACVNPSAVRSASMSIRRPSGDWVVAARVRVRSLSARATSVTLKQNAVWSGSARSAARAQRTTFR